MSGEITGFTIELYRKTTKKDLLEKGPEGDQFWVKYKTKYVQVQNCKENELLKQLRGQLYVWLKVVNPSRLRICKCHFWESTLRVSLWAFAVYNGVCYKCHVEGACSYC